MIRTLLAALAFAGVAAAAQAQPTFEELVSRSMEGGGNSGKDATCIGRRLVNEAHERRHF